MNCNNLDDYLCHLLNDNDAAAFESHVEACDSCCSAIEEDQQLMVMLQQASLLLDQPVPSLVVSTPTDSVASSEMPRSVRRRLGFAVGLSIAALLLLAVAVRSPPDLHQARPIENFSSEVVETTDSVLETTLQASAAPAPTVQVGPGLSQLRVSSSDPSIKIYMVVSKATVSSKAAAP